MKDFMERKCLVCQLQIDKKPKGAKYCSRKCYSSIPKTQEMKNKVSLAGIGRKQSDETKEKRAAKLRGMQRSKETIEKIQTARRWYYEQGPTEETRKRMSIARAGNPKVCGENAYNWKPNREEHRSAAARAKMCYSFIGRMLGWIEGGYRDLNEHVFKLGYSSNELANHLQLYFVEGMNWENFGTAWHIDHTRPISSFSLDTLLSVINALSNLRPMWARENLSKGAKWDKTLGL